MLMSTPTYGHYLFLGELSRYLDVSARELKEVLQPHPCKNAEEHDIFLTTFGISRDKHYFAACWHLLGCGHLYTLGHADCTRLLDARPNPTYW